MPTPEEIAEVDLIWNKLCEEWIEQEKSAAQSEADIERNRKCDEWYDSLDESTKAYMNENKKKPRTAAQIIEARLARERQKEFVDPDALKRSRLKREMEYKKFCQKIEREQREIGRQELKDWVNQRLVDQGML